MGAQTKNEGENDPVVNLAIGLIFTPGVPWALIFSDRQWPWWAELIGVCFWLYAITCLISGTVGVWSQYVRKQDRETALGNGTEAAITFWFGLIKWGMLAGLAFGFYLLATKIGIGMALIVALLAAILFVLVGIYDQRAKR